MAINDPNSIQPVDNRRVVPQPGTADASSAAEKPTAIFVNMTAAQAEEYGLTDEYKKANTDGKDGITQEEYDYYQAHKDDPSEVSEEAEATETDTASGTTATEKDASLFDSSKTVTSSTGTGSSIWTGGEDTARTGTNPVVLTNPSVAASVSTDLYSKFEQAQADAKAKVEANQKAGMPEFDYADESEETTESTNLYPGLKRADYIKNLIQRANVASWFDPFDKDGDGVISWDEFVEYAGSVKQANTNELIAYEAKIKEYLESGECKTRTEAIKRLTDKSAQESLQKQETALSSFTFDRSKVDLSNATEWNKEEIETISKNIESIGQIHAGMTREDAKRIGGETEKIFNEICPDGKNTVEAIDILKYVTGGEKDSDGNKTMEKLFKTIDSVTTKTNLTIQKGLLNITTGKTNISLDKFSEAIDNIKNYAYKNDVTFLDYLRDSLDCDNKKKDEWEQLKKDDSEENLKKRGQYIGNLMRQELTSALDMNSSNVSEIYYELVQIKNGKMNDYLKSLGYKDGEKVTDEEAQRLARDTVVQKYVKSIQGVIEGMQESLANETDPEKKKAKSRELRIVVNSLQEAVGSLGIPQINALLESITITGITDEEEQRGAVKDVVNEGGAKLENGNTVVGAILTSTIINTGDEESIEEFFKQNTEHIEDIQFIAKDIIKSMPESPKKDRFAEFINNTIDEIIAQNNGSSSSDNSHSTSSSKGSGQGSSIQETILSLLQWNTQQNNTPKFSFENLNTQNQIFQNDDSVTDVTEVSGSRADQTSINHAGYRFKTEMGIPNKLRYAQARIQNMSKTKMFELVAKNFDRIPDQYKEEVVNYFKQMPTQVLVETAIENDDVKDFMFEHKFIKMDDIVNYIRKHPQLMESGNKQISDSLKEQLKEFAKEQKLDDIHV